MPTMAAADPRWQVALDACFSALRRMSRYELPASLNRHLLDLGERKESLSAVEHDELLALVDFTQQRTADKLEAELVLERLGQVVPDVGGRS